MIESSSQAAYVFVASRSFTLDVSNGVAQAALFPVIDLANHLWPKERIFFGGIRGPRKLKTPRSYISKCQAPRWFVWKTLVPT